MAVRAPAFIDASWLNSPVHKLTDFRGQMLLLDFFTYGCINCLNNLPAIKQLQREFKTLAVIGIHTGKFAREKETPAIQKALDRLGITYAVINDAEAKLFDAYAIKAWPTMVLIDERGYIAGQWSGEGQTGLIRALLAKDAFQSTVLKRKILPEKLHYPQKLLCTEEFIFIANTGANAVWQCDYNGKVLAIFDAFNSPMGMAYVDHYLYVADSGAHEVVRIDTMTNRRETILEHVRAPYDLLVQDNLLVVALAGSHEILLYDLQSKEELLRIGNRFEALRDGDLATAQLAQPSGLSSCGDVIWFVDAESSSLRSIEDGQVKSYIGEGLFTFGDSSEAEILLQHPQDLVCGQIGDGCGGGRLFIADTYNHKIKAYDPESNTILTLLEGLDEPAGISKKGCDLFIADTNAHRIIRFNLSVMEESVFYFRR